MWFRLQQLRDETQRRDEQLNHNTVVMMEMQDTIHNLQRELSLVDHKQQQQQQATYSSQVRTITWRHARYMYVTSTTMFVLPTHPQLLFDDWSSVTYATKFQDDLSSVHLKKRRQVVKEPWPLSTPSFFRLKT